jgi:hypothetical protein
MRLLILAAAATLVITGTAQAAQHHHPRRQHAINAPAAEGSVPADTLGAHDLYIRNLHDSGYNPAADNVAN